MIVGFILGMFVGAFLGLVVAGLCVCSKDIE